MKAIKTSAWKRQLSLTTASAKVGAVAGTHILLNAWLPKEKRTEKNKAVLSKQAQQFVHALSQLKGSAVKIGQMMALLGDHVLPDEIAEALRAFEESDVAYEWALLAPYVQDLLGRAFGDFDVDAAPIGAGSLAQVHKAFHKPTEQWVCLKVQYPEVADAVDSDLKSIARLMMIFKLVKKEASFNAWIEEVRQLLQLELDFQREAKVTADFADLCKDLPLVQVPTVYSEYTSSRLMVSSFEAGVPVTDESVRHLSLERRNAIAQAFLKVFLKEVFEWDVLQTDPNFGNYRLFIDEYGQDQLVLLDFGAALAFDDDFLSPVRQMLIGAIQNDYAQIKQGAIDLDIMQEQNPEAVHQDFAALCQMLVEPFTTTDKQYLNDEGDYRWQSSQLPKRAAKHAAQSAMSAYFVTPPRAFTFLSRKLLGVYRFIATLDAEFDPRPLIKPYLTP